MIHNGVEIQEMTYNGKEVETWIHNGVEVYAGIHGKYVVQNKVVITKYASGSVSSSSRCVANESSASSKDALTLVDKVVGRPMTLKFRGATTVNCFNGQLERYAYVECNGVRVATVNLIEANAGNLVDETITVNFTPTNKVIYIGTYTRRDAGDITTQWDEQVAEIISLQIV